MNPEAKKLEKKGFKIFIGDQSDPNFWEKFYKKVGKVDILLDDGGHKNIQQVTTFMESYNYIKPGGMIIIEDTHTSFMKKKGFKNPSKYSFVSFSKYIIENLHRRNPMVEKKLNDLSQKIESITFYDSIVCINFNLKKIMNKTKLIENNQRLRDYFIDYRHKSNLINSLKFFEKIFGKINENTLLYKIIRKTFHRNFFVTLKEKNRIKKYINLLKSH